MGASLNCVIFKISKQQGLSKQPSKEKNKPVNQTLGNKPISEQLSICACNPQKNTIHIYYERIVCNPKK